MKGLGYCLLVLGIIWLLVALNMDTSVATDFGRVNNIGLMASKQNHIILGGFITFCGLMISIFGNGSKSASTKGTVKCPFCAEAISPEAIKCKHCGSDVSDALSSAKLAKFQPSDMSFDEFFIRRKIGFDVNERTVDELISRMKQANPGVPPINIEKKYREKIEELKNQLPSSIREEFMRMYHARR